MPVFTFFRGEPEVVVERARESGALTIYQVTTVAEAEAAVRAGVDMLVAQGSEAGGHVGPIALAEILPAVVRVAGGRPVLAAGGIVDGPDSRLRSASAPTEYGLGLASSLRRSRLPTQPTSRRSSTHSRVRLSAPQSGTSSGAGLGPGWRFAPSGTPSGIAGVDAKKRSKRFAMRSRKGSRGRNATVTPTKWTSWLARVRANRSIEPAGDLVRTIAADAERVLPDPPGRFAG